MSSIQVFDIWAEWCPPCKKFAPIFDALAKEYTNFDFVKVEADLNPEFLQENNIRSIPTILIINENEIVFQHAGILADWQMRDILDKF